MYHVPSATILAVGTRFLSTTNQYFSTNFFLVESNRIHFSQCTIHFVVLYYGKFHGIILQSFVVYHVFSPCSSNFIPCILFRVFTCTPPIHQSRFIKRTFSIFHPYLRKYNFSLYLFLNYPTPPPSSQFSRFPSKKLIAALSCSPDVLSNPARSFSNQLFPILQSSFSYYSIFHNLPVTLSKLLSITLFSSSSRSPFFPPLKKYFPKTFVL